MSTPARFLIRGGQVEWRVDAYSDGALPGRHVYKDFIVSVTGITKSVTFDGSLQGCTPVVVFQRNTITEGFAIGDWMALGIAEGNSLVTSWLWTGYIDDIVVGDTEVTVTLSAALTRINQDFSLYYPFGNSCRGMADFFYRQTGLIGGLSQLGSFNDNHYRSCGRLSTKFSTLGKLTGVTNYSVITYHAWTSTPNNAWISEFDDEGTLIRKRPPEDEDGMGTGYNWTITGSLKPEQWSLSWGLGDSEGERGFLPVNPLTIHRNDFTLRMRNVWQYNAIASATLDHWQIGEIRQRSTTVTPILHQTSLYSMRPRIESEGTEESCWIVNPNGKFKKAGYTVDEYGGRVAIMVPKDDFDTIEIKVNVTPLTVAPWKDDAQALIGGSWSPAEGTSRQDTFPLDKLALFSKDSIGDPDAPSSTTRPSKVYLGSITYKSTDISPDWDGTGKELSSFYALETLQDLTPVTISSDPLTFKDHGKELLELSSVGYYEDGTNIVPLKTTAVDTCPESGEVFGVPLSDDFIIDWAFDTYNWLPSSATINVRDMWGQDFAINTDFESAAGNNTNAKEYNLIQSQLFHSAYPWSQYANKSSGQRGYRLPSDDWSGNPGFVYDRWTGCDTADSSASISQTVLTNAYQYGEYLLCEDGTKKEVYSNLGGGSITPSSTYCVRDSTGECRYHLNVPSGTAHVNEVVLNGLSNGGANLLPQQDAPYVDIFPLMALKLAVHRAFTDYRRPTYRVTASPAFAVVNPGDIVYLQTMQYDSGNPWLALVMSISFDSNANGPSLLIAPLKSVASIPVGSTAWTGLDEVKNIVTHHDENEGIFLSPFLKYLNTDHSTPPEYKYHTTVITNGVVAEFSGSSWWYPLNYTGTSNRFYLTGNPLSPVKFHWRNVVTGYETEYVVYSTDWDWNDDGQGNIDAQARYAKMDDISRVLIGDDYLGKGLILYQYIGTPERMELVFNCPDLPDLSGWEFWMEYNDPAYINYYEPMFWPENTKWESNKTYQSGGSNFNITNVADIIAARDYLVWKFDHDEWNAHDVCFFSHESGSTSSRSWFYFSLPWDGVFNEMYTVFYPGTSAAAIRFTIAPDFRANYSQSSQMAQAYFSSPVSADSYTKNLIEGATIKLCKIIKGF